MLLNEVFPRPEYRRRYSSLPVLASVLEGYAGWLLDNGHRRYRIQMHFRALRRLDGLLCGLGVHSVGDLTRGHLQACNPASRLEDPELAMVVRSLDRYLEAEGLFSPPPSTPIVAKVAAYRSYLQDVRGLAPSTAMNHALTVTEFLEDLHYERNPARLAALTRADLESFVCKVGERVGRGRLQHVVAYVRSFLRFLAAEGEVPPGLDAQIDTPRLYRGEQLPRSLPWESVSAILCSIDRSTPMGRRDYAMLLLIATYGLRSCDVAALTLDDIEWRAERIRVPQRKTSNPIVFPLTDEVGASLVDYLRHGRSSWPCREIFLRCEAPQGPIRPSTVASAFRKWSRRSGLPIPFTGPHCMRHPYAVHLLREGTSLKTIGELLGHRTAENTYVYLRLAIEDLREVALPLPEQPIADEGQEGAS